MSECYNLSGGVVGGVKKQYNKSCLLQTVRLQNITTATATVTATAAIIRKKIRFDLIFNSFLENIFFLFPQKKNLLAKERLLQLHFTYLPRPNQA